MLRIFRVHFNRIAMQRGDPNVWSVRLSDRCLHGTKVQFVGSVPLETDYRPNQRQNPRAFFKGVGDVRRRRDGTIVIREGY